MQSCYKRDFTWPTYLSSKDSKRAELPELELTREEYKDKDKDLCEKERKGEGKQSFIKSSGDSETFEAVPEYLIKLFKKYPHLHTFYQEAGEEQLMKRIEEEVYKTSYQIDFGREGFIAKDDYDELIEIAEALREKRQKVCNAEVHGDEGNRLAQNCTANAEPCICDDGKPVAKLAMRPVSITKMPRIPRESKKTESADKESFRGKGEAPDKAKPTSEYKDTFDKLATVIIKYKLHAKKYEFAL